MPNAPPLASAATVATHASPTIGRIATMPIAALLETDSYLAIPAIPSLPVAVNTGSGRPPLFYISNNDFYTPSDVALLDRIEEVTNEVLFSGIVLPNVRAGRPQGGSVQNRRSIWIQSVPYW